MATAREYCALIAGQSGVDAGAIWEWGFLERVSSGLYVRSLDFADEGEAFLATAERLASASADPPSSG